jgi:murein DD-endopeptidase MepM/ murein hydrolase activator NlpD
MSWREVTAIVWLGFSLGALTDTALRARRPGPAEAGHYDVSSSPAEAREDPASRGVEAGGRQPDQKSNAASGGKSHGVSGLSRTKDDETRATATTGISDDDAVEILRHRDLEIPVDGVHRKDLHDTFAETRSGTRPHEALDILAERHTPVKAVEDGTVEKLFTSKAGGLTIYQFDPTGTFCYYYAHLNAYAAGLREGQRVHKDDVIGYVGSTGNASPDAPHLHFAIFRLTPERKWWKGEPINPYPVLR